MIGAGFRWEEVKTHLRALAGRIPEGEVLELCVFGGATVLHWGMEDRFSRDVDVQQSRCSPNLLKVAKAAGEACRFREVEDPEPEGFYIEIAPLEADAYLPRFSVFERVEVAPNLILHFPAPAEIAASKLAFADHLARLKDLQDIAFIRERFALTQEQILRKVFTIQREGHRRCAVLNFNQLETLISQIPERQAALQRHLEEQRLGEGVEEEGQGPKI
jgi:hypothetical protein